MFIILLSFLVRRIIFYCKKKIAQRGANTIEVSVQDSQAALQTLLQLLNHKAMAVIQTTGDRTLSFADCNETLLELTGYSRQELLSQDPLSLLADTPLSHINRTRNLLTRRQYFKTEAAFWTPKKQRLHIELELHPLALPGGDLQLVIVEPICTRKWIKHQLIKQSVIVSGVLSPSLVIELYDPYFDSILEHKMAYETFSALDFISELDYPAVQQALTEISEQGKPKELVLRTTKLSNVLELELKITLRPFFNGSGRLFNYGFIITELKPYEESDNAAIRLKIVMAQRSMSAQALAEATGITVQTISKLRNGKIAKPQRLTAQLIAAELGVSVSDIWSDTGK